MTTMCLSNELSWMSPSTEVTFDPVSYERGEKKLFQWTPTRNMHVHITWWYQTDPTILLLPTTVKCTLCHGFFNMKSPIQYVI